MPEQDMPGQDMPGLETKHKVRDVNVRMLQAGSGPPVLFLHGANGLPQWLPFFDLIAAKCTLRVPEHPGFGTSDNPAWLRSIGDLSMYYLDFLDGLGATGIHLVGQSLGGWVAAEVAARNCTHLASLTLLAPAGLRVKGHLSGDNFIWDAEELVRNLYHDQAIADRIARRSNQRRAGRHHAGQPFHRCKARLGTALVRPFAGTLAASHSRTDTGGVG